jgi:hypothetical protein
MTARIVVRSGIDRRPWPRAAPPAGAFADLSFPPPYVSVYHQSPRCQGVEIRVEPLQTFG